MVLLREHQIKVKMLSAELEAADSTIRADLAQLALNFPLESRRGPMVGIAFLPNRHLRNMLVFLLCSWRI